MDMNEYENDDSSILWALYSVYRILWNTYLSILTC